MTTTPKPSPRQLAELIAEELMRNNYGMNVTLLEQQDAAGFGCHELNRAAVIDRIVKVLEDSIGE